MLEMRNVIVTAGSRRLLSDVSMRVQPGKLTCVVGPNGAGKSTALRILAGERAAAGSVTLDGREMDSWNPRELARRRAVLSQNVDVAFAMRAGEVALLGRIPHNDGGRESREDRRIVRRALGRLGAEAFASRSYPTLSGGEKQRVQLARVLAQVWPSAAGEHAYLLLDEPTSALDPVHQHHVLRLLRRRARAGAGVLVVLHDLGLAFRYADVVVVLRAGRVVTCGAVAEALSPGVIAGVFGVRARIVGMRRPVLVTSGPAQARAVQ